MGKGQGAGNPTGKGRAPRKPVARTDRKRWCKDQHGVKHVPHLVFRPRGVAYTECRLARDFEVWCRDGWVCMHRDECARCGQVLRPRLGGIPREECPTFQQAMKDETREILADPLVLIRIRQAQAVVAAGNITRSVQAVRSLLRVPGNRT